MGFWVGLCDAKYLCAFPGTGILMPGSRAAVVNRVLPWRNEMSTHVPLLSHKGRTHWLRIAFTGVSAVAGATRDLPAVFAAAEALAGLGKRRSGEGRSCRRLGVRLPRGGVCLRTSAEARVAKER